MRLQTSYYSVFTPTMRTRWKGLPRGWGLTVYRDSSCIFNSEYIEVADKNCDEYFKIHVSEHALPSHYTQPDVNVLKKAIRSQNIRISFGLRLLVRWGVSVPKYVQNLIDKADGEKAAKAEKARITLTDYRLP